MLRCDCIDQRGDSEAQASQLVRVAKSLGQTALAMLLAAAIAAPPFGFPPFGFDPPEIQAVLKLLTRLLLLLQAVLLLLLLLLLQAVLLLFALLAEDEVAMVVDP